MAEVAQGAPSPENPNTTMRISPQPPKPSAIRSRQSRYPVTIFFFNASSSHVSVQWVNYEGVAAEYQVLAPGESYRQESFATHPWLFREILPSPQTDGAAPYSLNSFPLQDVTMHIPQESASPPPPRSPLSPSSSSTASSSPRSPRDDILPTLPTATSTRARIQALTIVGGARLPRTSRAYAQLFWRRVDPSVAAVPWRERWRYLPRPRLARTPARTPAQGAVAAAVEAVGQGVDGKAAEGSSSFGQYFVTQDNEMALVIDKRNVKPAEYPVTIRRPALVAWSPATHTQFLDPLFRAQVKTLLLCYKRGCRMAAEHAVALGEQSPLASVTKGKQVVHADTMASSGGDKPHRRSRSSSPGGSPPLAIWLGMLPYELVISIIAAASPFALVGHWPGSEEWGKKASMANLALSGCYRCQ
eukprot:jgi/Mesvir1/1924/Mv22953-RA.1